MFGCASVGLLMWTRVGWETESVWGTLWLNFLSRELPGTSINNTATPLRLTPHTQRQFLFLKDFFQRPALKAVLHVATCNCLGPVRQVIKTIEKCAVALLLPDNLFLICVNRNFDTALPSSKHFFFKQKCPWENRMPTLYLYFRWSQHK